MEALSIIVKYQKYPKWPLTLELISEMYFIQRNAAAAKSLRSCPTLCDPRDSSPPGSPVPGILQARTLEWGAISFSNVWKWKVKIESEAAQSCPTLCDPIDGSLPSSSIPGILQARTLEWVAISFSNAWKWKVKVKLLSRECYVAIKLNGLLLYEQQRGWTSQIPSWMWETRYKRIHTGWFYLFEVQTR